MNSVRHNGNGLSTVQHKRHSSLNISLAGGTPAQRTALHELQAALVDLRIEIAEISASGQAPAQGDAVRILMILLDEDLELMRWAAREARRQWV